MDITTYSFYFTQQAGCNTERAAGLGLDRTPSAPGAVWLNSGTQSVRDKRLADSKIQSRGLSLPGGMSSAGERGGGGGGRELDSPVLTDLTPALALRLESRPFTF